MDAEYRRSIISYYDNTRLDYRILWFNKKSSSVHFGYYDREVKTHEEALVNLNKVMALKGSVKDGDIILDAGCGRGGSAIWLAENYDVKVTGITLFPNRVKQAQKATYNNQLANTLTYL